MSQAVPGLAAAVEPKPACAAPAGAGRQAESRAALGPALGALRPLCEELADSPGSSRGQARPGAEAPPKAFARAAAERRKVRPARVMGWASPAIRRQA